MDVTYTIAPISGWSAIEISAGIVSACLPTMSPVVGVVLKGLHIIGENGIVSRLRTSVSRGGDVFPSRTTKSQATGKKDDLNSNLSGSCKVKGTGHFYRLSELEEVGESSHGRNGSGEEGLELSTVLVIEHHSLAEPSDDGASDEIPLSSIRAHKVEKIEEIGASHQ